MSVEESKALAKQALVQGCQCGCAFALHQLHIDPSLVANPAMAELFRELRVCGLQGFRALGNSSTKDEGRAIRRRPRLAIGLGARRPSASH